MASAVRKVATQKMRAAKRLAQSQAPRKPRKRQAPKLTKRKILKAIIGTGGIRKLIAERCGCCYMTIFNAMHKWPEVMAAIKEEEEKIADLAQQTIRFAIEQRLDLNIASQNARWLLTRARYRDRGMGDESKVIHEGGDKPVQVRGGVPIEALDLPIEVRRKILEALDQKIEADKAKGESSEG